MESTKASGILKAFIERRLQRLQEYAVESETTDAILAWEKLNERLKADYAEIVGIHTWAFNEMLDLEHSIFLTLSLLSVPGEYDKLAAGWKEDGPLTEERILRSVQSQRARLATITDFLVSELTNLGDNITLQ